MLLNVFRISQLLLQVETSKILKEMKSRPSHDLQLNVSTAWTYSTCPLIPIDYDLDLRLRVSTTDDLHGYPSVAIQYSTNYNTVPVWQKLASLKSFISNLRALA
jgi:hypothetical protein